MIEEYELLKIAFEKYVHTIWIHLPLFLRFTTFNFVASSVMFCSNLVNITSEREQKFPASTWKFTILQSKHSHVSLLHAYSRLHFLVLPLCRQTVKTKYTYILFSFLLYFILFLFSFPCVTKAKINVSW